MKMFVDIFDISKKIKKLFDGWLDKWEWSKRLFWKIKFKVYEFDYKATEKIFSCKLLAILNY